jgi:alkanesulfonate monooxygenase SsuD/methylene tetrahydromethanopterin reductase-like flavin-dependent oxidoreductase (luciferase family)
MAPSLGICFHRYQPAADIVAEARAAEEAGFDELWVVEDCFYTAGPSLAAAALAVTEQIRVGIGIVPSRSRQAAVTAMEFATLTGLGPDRFLGGIGHGVGSWMNQMGIRPASPLTALEETLTAVRRLLAGETVTMDGRYVTLREVALSPAPDSPPPLLAGVRNEKSLQLSGRCADGTILAELCSPTYLAWARDRIAEGGGGSDHRLTVFCSGAVDSDGAAARAALVPFVAGVFADASVGLRMLPFYDELSARAADSSWEEAVGAMPEEWWRHLGPIGTPDDAARYLTTMADSGADSLVLFPDLANPIDDLRRFAATVRPLLG